ncbi:MAG TPA: HRDC domain-containing protein, partial [Nitriliruptoraceae bacterium]|nr:HRDC domain-containing protein [Nitriliruptoraceae bacterium]
AEDVTTRPARIVDGQVSATEGVRITAPGGVTSTVTGMEGVGARRRVALDVAGVRAHLAVDAPVWVDDQRATLVAPRSPVADRRSTTTADGDPAMAVSRLDAHRRARQDRLADADREIVLTSEGQERFEALRSWRTDQARAQGMPPYIVFNDKTLNAIADTDPTTLDELLDCPGVGPTKLDRYGDEILEVLDGL